MAHPDIPAEQAHLDRAYECLERMRQALLRTVGAAGVGEDGFDIAAGRIEAWVDRHAGWLDEYDRKVAAGQTDLAGELAEGAALFGEGTVDAWRKAAPLLGARERDGATRSEQLEVDVERERARAGAWYELFPRSWGGLSGVAKVVPELARLGFDVLYLPPIHPIGETNRKGRNNAERAEPGDVGSPWAIGSAAGGHDAIHPELAGPGDGAAAADALAAIRELPATYAETLMMRLVEGMTGPEIAAATGMTPGSVRVNLHRGMKLLRRRLGEDER